MVDLQESSKKNFLKLTGSKAPESMMLATMEISISFKVQGPAK